MGNARASTSGMGNSTDSHAFFIYFLNADEGSREAMGKDEKGNINDAINNCWIVMCQFKQ